MGALLALVAPLGGCRSSLLDPAGPVGAAERTLLLDALALMLAIVIPTLLAVLATAFWFRAGNARAVRRPTFAYSGRLELLVWSIPALTVLFLGGVAWVSAHDLDPARPLASRRAPLEIDVVAMDWKWLFIYPAQGVASVNRLVAPAGTPLRLRVTSASVFNGFFVPALGSQIYAMNGMVEDLNLMAARQGRFHGLSSHFSGDGFADMGFEVEATSDAGFAAFLAGAKAGGGLLDAKAYARLEAPGVAPAPVTFGALAPRLFETVALRRSDAAPAPPPPPPQAVSPNVRRS
jgi:cytochrome o ubiquinol oxidase subunit 2